MTQLEVLSAGMGICSSCCGGFRLVPNQTFNEVLCGLGAESCGVKATLDKIYAQVETPEISYSDLETMRSEAQASLTATKTSKKEKL